MTNLINGTVMQFSGRGTLGKSIIDLHLLR